MFQPTTALESAIVAGDGDATLALLRAMAPAERARQRTSLLPLTKVMQAARWGKSADWDGTPNAGQRLSLDTAIVLCGTAGDVVAAIVDDELLVALGREFRPRSLDGLADAMLAHSPQWIRAVQRLISAGLVPRPDSEDYVLGLMSMPRIFWSVEKLAAAFAADPGLKPQLLRVFEIEGTADVSLASSDKYNHTPELAWGRILLSLVDDGLTTRADLLERTLGALEKDWPQYRAGWFSRFHAEMAPEAVAMRLHLPRYLALCRSRIPPTVALALASLKTLDDAQAIDGAVLIDALEPVMASGVKGQLEAAMKLLDAVVRREPALATRASTAIALGLLHEAAAVQGGVLKRLAAWGLDGALRARLGEFDAGIAAVNRPTWAKLVGASPASVPAAAPPSAETAPARVHPLDDARRLGAIGDLQDLVERIAHVFEHPDDVDAFEAALARLVEAAPLSAGDKPLFAPVRKRAAKMKQPLPGELARLLMFVLDGTRRDVQPEADHGGNLSPAGALLIDRVHDLMNIAAQGRRLPPLGAPTHRGGFIAPAALIERVAAHQAAGLVSPPAEQALALLRLAPAASNADRARARTLADSAFTRSLRYALGDDVAPGPERELFAAAARIRRPREDDARLDALHPDLGPDGALAARHVWRVGSLSGTYDGTTYTQHHLHADLLRDLPADAEVPRERLAVRRHPRHGETRRYHVWWSFGGIDEGTIAWSASLLPSDPEAMLAEGACAIGNNLDWGEAQWQNRAYLALLLDPLTRVDTPMGTLLLALGLVGKEAGQTAMAVDALVQSHAEGRLDASLLADTVRALFATPLPKAARLHKSLQAATRADPSTHGLVFDLLCAVLQARPDDPPRDTASLLELLLELKLAGRRTLPAAARDAVASMTLSGKGRTAQRALLD